MPTKKITKKPNIKTLHKAIDEHKAQELDKKFKTNKFVQSYQEDLEQSGFLDEILESADQVKSWSRYDKARIYDQIARSIVMFLLGVIIGVVVVSL
jgi:type II secretory pathway component PulF